MVINGRVRQACSALVDKLLEDQPEEIELQPTSKFPVIRDLWSIAAGCSGAREVQGLGAGRRLLRHGPRPATIGGCSKNSYPLSECMSCGCCLEACPQYGKVELQRHEGETTADRERASRQRSMSTSSAPHAISQVIRFNMDPTGKLNAGERLAALTEPGGIQVCGNAQNCVAVCPKTFRSRPPSATPAETPQSACSRSGSISSAADLAVKSFSAGLHRRAFHLAQMNCRRAQFQRFRG